MHSMISLFILDDSQEFIFLLTSFFTSKGINVDAEFNVENALEKLESNKYDVIITDYLMGDVDGISFANKVKNIEINKNANILLLTAKNLEKEELARAEELDLTYLTKPILPNDLLDEIVKAVKK